MLQSAKDGETQNDSPSTQMEIVFDGTSKILPVKKKKKRAKDSDKFGYAIICLKEDRASAVEELYKRYINAFTDKEDGGLGESCHLEYMANKGNLVEPLVKRLKDEGFIPDVFTSRGRKIVAVDLQLQ